MLKNNKKGKHHRFTKNKTLNTNSKFKFNSQKKNSILKLKHKPSRHKYILKIKKTSKYKIQKPKRDIQQYEQISNIGCFLGEASSRSRSAPCVSGHGWRKPIHCSMTLKNSLTDTRLRSLAPGTLNLSHPEVQNLLMY